MKGKIWWIVNIMETFIGFILFITAQMEISGDSSYSWRRPYSDYEQQVITTKWIGLVLLIGGGIWLGIRIYQYVYVNKHTQDLNEIAKLGGIAKCQTCGLTVTQNLTFCPRCGSAIPKRPAEFTNINN